MKDSSTSTLRRRLRRSIGGLAVAGGVAALALMAAPALAAPASASVTGPLAINGSVHGAAAVANETKMPLVYRGVVTTSGVLVLGNGNSKTHTLKAKAGDLVVTQTGTPQQSQTENAKTCHVAYTEDLVYKLQPTKSTRSSAGVTGTGAAQIGFSGTMPRYTSGSKKGQCNFTAKNPIAKTAKATFVAAAVVTTH